MIDARNWRLPDFLSRSRVTHKNTKLYSLVRLVVPNTEELISRPFMSDHPHQRETRCFAKGVNKVGVVAMPTNFGGSRVSYGPGAAIGSLIDP